jgi:predicted acetyltransferase
MCAGYRLLESAKSGLARAKPRRNVPGVPTIRTIDADELHAWMTVPRTAMLGSPPEAEMVETRSKAWELDRCFAAFDDAGKLCGTVRSFTTEITLPGDVTVPAGAVSGVGVLPTHRRQGHLTAMMKAMLDDGAERGESVSVLVAAEYPIYGRYGYGPATEACQMRMEAPGPDGWLDPPAPGGAELADNETFRVEGRALYERVRRQTPGHIFYPEEYWDVAIGEAPWADDLQRRAKAPKVLWRDATGEVQAAAMYSVDDNWEHNRPMGVLRVEMLISATDEAEREMVRFLASVDWIRSLRLGLRPTDDPLPFMLRDGRAAGQYDGGDHVWARVLDVPEALASRRYATAGRLVLDVDDPQGHATGRFLLEADSDGNATCSPTDESPDLVVPVTTLSAAYLGGYSWARLAAGGWVQEERAGAVATASTLFTMPRSPWCAFTF